MANPKNRQPPGVQQQIFGGAKVGENPSAAFIDERSVKRALAALQRGPIRFQRNRVIACEGEGADYIFLIVSGVVRTCKTFQNGTRGIVAFYLPGDFLGFWPSCSLSVEAAANAVVLFLKRDGLLSVASRESSVASFSSRYCLG